MSVPGYVRQSPLTDLILDLIFTVLEYSTSTNLNIDFRINIF